MDKLLLQVNADNVLAVHAAFRRHANELITYLQQLESTLVVGVCGGDPVSSMAAGPDSFGGKVRKLAEVHWNHGRELSAVADQLRETARRYGHTDDEIDQAFRSLANQQ